MFPVARPRRLRQNENIRDFIAETPFDLKKLIMPVFVDENASKPVPIASMPGIFRHGISGLDEYLSSLDNLGIRGILLFGIPSHKDEEGTASYDPDGVVQKAAGIAKDNTALTVMADLCMCEYTTHGHCGILNGSYVDNDSTLESYGRIALSYANAGVDMIAPSGMMDGQVGYLRSVLDQNGHSNMPILAYSVKYASNMYGPFRNAADSAPSFGDRRSYQMDPRNSMEAMKEISLDIEEGADIIMVKPALPYLDIIRRAKDTFDYPVAAYSVSGEYTMLRNAIDQGLLGRETVHEVLNSIFRSGADMVITYFAEELSRDLQNRG